MVVLTWDEGTKPREAGSARYDHYSLLETTENMVGPTTCLGPRSGFTTGDFRADFGLKE